MVGNYKSKMAQIRNIIFDFDGTLADTSKLIVATMHKSIKEYGLPSRTEEQIRATIGVRLEEIPSILWPSHKDIGVIFAMVYRKNFEELKKKIQITLFEGVKESLSELYDKGYQMAVATSRSHRSVEDLVKRFGINDAFVYILGGDDVSIGKPNPESIYKIMSERDWNPTNTLMVGDMPVDIKMGKMAGLMTCGVTYGNGEAIELENAGANFMISTFKEIFNIL